MMALRRSSCRAAHTATYSRIKGRLHSLKLRSIPRQHSTQQVSDFSMGYQLGTVLG